MLEKKGFLKKDFRKSFFKSKIYLVNIKKYDNIIIIGIVVNTTNKIIRRNHNRSKGYDLENEEKYNNDNHNTYSHHCCF